MASLNILSSRVDERAAAAALGISHRTLQSWRVRGGGPTYIKMGRSVRYDIAQLEAWARARERASTSAA
jgi:hypothetical protein